MNANDAAHHAQDAAGGPGGAAPQRLVAIAELQLDRAQAGDLDTLAELTESFRRAAAELRRPAATATADLARALVLSERAEAALSEQRRQLQAQLLALRGADRAAQAYAATALAERQLRRG